MIDQGLDGQKRIKMYADDNGDFKGEAMVVYFKRESVGMAVRMMDDSWFRPGEPATIKVQEADMSFKKTKDAQEAKQNMVRRDKKANERTRAEMNR
jgi:HIV Tat-specific factor 1